MDADLASARGGGEPGEIGNAAAGNLPATFPELSTPQARHRFGPLTHCSKEPLHDGVFAVHAPVAHRWLATASQSGHTVSLHCRRW